MFCGWLSYFGSLGLLACLLHILLEAVFDSLNDADVQSYSVDVNQAAEGVFLFPNIKMQQNSNGLDLTYGK